MTETLLEGKLHAPARRRNAVDRPRLLERLDRGADAKLTLVSAPAGFGKSTLLAEHRARRDEAASAWLSLDAGDDDPRAFWTHVVAALRNVAPGVGATALPLIESAQVPIRSVVAALLNDLGAVSGDVELVLDDYHLVESPEIHEQMAWFLERLPPRTHVVIATRADPALPLARMRARGELVEVRAADLRFTPDEASAYLNGALGLGLPDADLSVLATRTEGWIAALQLAGLSMEGRDDVSAFIASFAGDDRYIIDYLVEEVLDRQSDAARRFLLQTSILARMSGPLCDAVTGEPGGATTLQALERGNLFVVPLDDRREWYRYHHLFADVLRAHLKAERADEVADLHRRASAWHERNGDRTEAIEHAMAAEDHGRAAELVELAIADMNRGRQEGALRRMLEALPPTVLEDRPVLSVGYVGALMSTGQFEGAEDLLDRAERTLEHPVVVADETAFRHLPGTIAMYRTALAQVRGDVADTIEHAERALELIAADDLVRWGGVSALLGLAHWTDGNLDEAYRSFDAGMVSLGRGGHRADVVGGAVTLADIRIAQGRLEDARRLYERGLEIATANASGPPLRGAADMHVGLAWIALERNELEAAAGHLRENDRLGEENGLPKNPWRSRAVAARLRQAEGDTRAALELLDAAERVFVSDFSPDVRPVPAMRARVWIAANRLDEARSWAAATGLAAGDEPSYLREFEHATLARLLVATGRHAEAVELADRLLLAAEAGGRQGSALDVLVVAAVARHAAGDASGAMETLARATDLAEREGHVRVFVEEGAAMGSLLRRAAAAGPVGPFLARVVAAAGADPGRREQAGPLAEPLSARELEVLHLLGTDLTGPEIAAQLVVSLNTVRTHTKSIFAKLAVNSRRAAVRRATELDLLR